jgi:lipid-A-disaccharide synthase-like uncharacterized protein
MNFYSLSINDIIWLVIGFTGQIVFSLRFFIQWLKSERAGRSFIPKTFWYYSILGSLILLVYSIHNQDPVYIFAQLFGTIIYSRNLYLIRKEQQQLLDAAGSKATAIK